VEAAQQQVDNLTPRVSRQFPYAIDKYDQPTDIYSFYGSFERDRQFLAYSWVAHFIVGASPSRGLTIYSKFSAESLNI